MYVWPFLAVCWLCWVWLKEFIHFISSVSGNPLSPNQGTCTSYMCMDYAKTTCCWLFKALLAICSVLLIVTVSQHTHTHTHTHTQCTYRSLRTQLLLWPSHPLSPSSRLHSPTFSRLVFTCHTGIAYAHITQRVYPLKTSAATSAELTEISSTVSDPTKKNDQNDAKILANSSRLLNGLESVERDEKRDRDSLDKSSENAQQSLNGDANGSEGAIGDDDTSCVVKESTGTGQQHQQQRREARSSSECQPCGEYPCVYTDLPKFLVTYSPKVCQHSLILSVVFVCCIK